ncbi:MAG TPA: AMP-binding protein [Acidimicrobiales bacterium]|nr:AMP-binding protein [Acidimicrobiales bacterium]
MTTVLHEVAPTAAGGSGFETLPSIVMRRAREMGTTTAMREKHLGRWRTHTWEDYERRLVDIARGLHGLGVEPGDRVAVHSDNRPEWLFADMAIQALRAICVGIYPTSPSAEVEYLLNHSEAKVLLAEDEEQVDKVMAVRGNLPHLRKVVVIDTRGIDMADDLLMSLEELEAMGRSSDLDVAASAAASQPEDAAIIVYTSGTTGPPKGAMLSHRNLQAAAEASGEVFAVDPRAEVLSYLPLCHITERLVSCIDAVATGYVVNFGEGGETFTQDLREVQPTFFLGVPRVWEKMMAAITIRMEDAGALKRANYRFWMRTGAKVARKRWTTGKVRGIDKLTYGLGWLFLYRPLREKLGMSRIKGVLSGAAPIAPQVLEFFWTIGVPVREGYGQTENTAQATVTPPDDIRLGKVGKPLAGTEVKIAPDGEILTRGPGTFLGYFKDPQATAETIDAEGWLHTGDVGELDEDGFLTITDRKKDIIITAGGKNVSPSEIENMLKVSPFVKEAMVIGDQRPYLTALIGIELDTVSNWALHHRIGFTTYADLASKEEVVALIGTVVNEVNEQLAQVETIKRYALLPKELDEEDGEVTATQKVKRRAVEAEYRQQIEEMYR